MQSNTDAMKIAYAKKQVRLGKIKAGSVVAFNALDDATWFDVITVDGCHMLVREHGTEYAAQHSDTSLIRQVR